MSDWQPIETAPKDGTEIIVGESGTADVELCRWYDGEWVDRTYDPFADVTHWMPLPKPPQRLRKRSSSHA